MELCIICLEPVYKKFNSDCDCINTNFHCECIKQWYLHKKCCPVCKKPETRIEYITHREQVIFLLVFNIIIILFVVYEEYNKKKLKNYYMLLKFILLLNIFWCMLVNILYFCKSKLFY